MVTKTAHSGKKMLSVLLSVLLVLGTILVAVPTAFAEDELARKNIYYTEVTVNCTEATVGNIKATFEPVVLEYEDGTQEEIITSERFREMSTNGMGWGAGESQTERKLSDVLPKAVILKITTNNQLANHDVKYIVTIKVNNATVCYDSYQFDLPWHAQETYTYSFDVSDALPIPEYYFAVNGSQNIYLDSADEVFPVDYTVAVYDQNGSDLHKATTLVVDGSFSDAVSVSGTTASFAAKNGEGYTATFYAGFSEQGKDYVLPFYVNVHVPVTVKVVDELGKVEDRVVYGYRNGFPGSDSLTTSLSVDLGEYAEHGYTRTLELTSGDGTLSGTAYAFGNAKEQILTVKATPDTYTVTVSGDADQVSWTAPATATYGEDYIFTVSALEGAYTDPDSIEISAITGAANANWRKEVSGSTVTFYVTGIDADAEIALTSDLVKHNVSVTAAGDGLTAETSTSLVKHGETVALTVNLDTCYDLLNPTVTVEGEYALVSESLTEGVYTAVYTVNSDIAITVEANLQHTPGEETEEHLESPTCTEKGSHDLVVYCTRCRKELSRNHEEIDALGHDYQAEVTAPTCTEQGYTTYTCSRCNDSYTADYVNATGHSWTAEWNWAEDGKSATVTFTCANGDHPETVEAAIASEQTKDESCTEKGETTYTGTAAASDGFTVTDIKVVADVDATGHSWTADWTWAEDGKSATVTFTCENGDHPETVEAVITSEQTKGASCTEKGETTYTGTAAASDGFTVTDSKVVADVNALGHDYQAEVTAPTCTEQGYTTYTCSRCGDTYVDDKVDATGHSWTAEWNWAEDGKSATVTFTCANGDHPETVEAVIASKQTKDETCTEKGETTYTGSAAASDGYTVTDTKIVADVEAKGHDFGEWTVTVKPECEKAGEETRYCSRCDETETRPVEALGHKAGEAVEENRTEATCTEDGAYDVVTYCERCDKELGRETKSIPAKGHTPGEAVKENEIPANCDHTGGWDEVVYCTECGAELSRAHHEIPRTDHVDHDGDHVCDECGTGICPWCGEFHNRHVIREWWIELVHHILYIINRIFYWWTPFAK